MSIKERKFRSIKSLWNNIIPEDNGLFYLTYEYSQILVYLFYVRKIINFKSYFHKHLKFFVSDTTNTIIAPLCIDDRNRTIVLMGNIFSSGYNDFIYSSSCKEDDVIPVIEYVKHKYPNYTLEFNDVLEDSILNNNNILVLTDKRYCYKIHAVDGYDNWYNSLSKSARQNLRTAYNRLNTDNKKMEFITSMNVSQEEIEKMVILYKKRMWEILHKNINNLDFHYEQKKRKEIKKYIQTHPFFYCIGKNKRVQIARLYIDNDLAAFWISFKERDGIIVPRLAINSSFSRYSPGGLLINEYLKNSLDGMSYFSLDLSRGNEPYKKVYNGELYRTVKLSNIEYDYTNSIGEMSGNNG